METGDAKVLTVIVITGDIVTRLQEPVYAHLALHHNAVKIYLQKVVNKIFSYIS